MSVAVLALTVEQEEAVARREGDVLLTASAGSGKTRVLTERYVRAVVEDGVDPGRILAITFTEKAANELAERVRARLRELGHEEAARAAESAWIGTFHGWAARLLRAHPLVAGIDPRFTVLDEFGADRLERSTGEEALAAWLGQEGEPAQELVAAYGPARVATALRALHAELRARGAPVALPHPSPPDVSAAAAALRRAAADVRGEIGEHPKGLEALARCGAALDAGVDPLPTPLALSGLTFPKGNGNGLKGPACEHYRERLEAFRQSCLDARACATLPLLDAALGTHAAAYAEAKARRGVLDFADLELGAHALLAAHPGVRTRWRDTFTLVMVDEFQDTNPLQRDLLRLVEEGNLFTVGDPCQAIYGFRHADVRLLEERREELAPDEVLTLRENFRSHPSILRAAQDAFAPLLGDAFTGLLPGRPEAPGGPRVELVLAEYDGWDGDGLVPPGGPPPKHVWRLAEARLLAQEVRRLRDDGGFAEGDVVVLLRASGDLSTYARALEDAGLATYLVGGRGFWGRPEVQDLVAWLSVLANPRDELRLFEVLASPLAGVGADALVALAAAGPGRAWSTLVDPPPEGPLDRLDGAARERLATAGRLLTGERAEAARRPLPELIERAMLLTGYDLHLLRLSGGERRLANIRKLMRLAREWEDEEGRDLRGFLDLVADRGGDDAAEAREGEAPVDGEGLGAVRLMTIHRAKGLQFPAVCVADLGRQRAADEGALVRLGRQLSDVGVRVATPAGGASAPALAYRRLGEEDRARDEAEEKRLFYVAATRAQEHLLFSGAVRFAAWPGEGPRCPPVGWLAPALVPDLRERFAAGERRGRSGEVAWAVAVPGEDDVLRPEFRAPVPATPAAPTPPAPVGVPLPGLAVADRALDSISFSALELHRRCGLRFHAERVLGLPPKPEHGPGAGGGVLPGALRGTLVHALLEELPYREPFAPEPARVDAAAAREGARLTPAQRAEVAELVTAFARSPLFGRLARARRVAREERFAFVADGLLVTGVLDALVREGPAALVVDFKTNRLAGRAPGEIVEETYALQRLVYALALLRAGAAEVEVAFAFLEAPSEPVATRYATADVARLEAGLAVHTEPLRAGEHHVTEHPHAELCTGCPIRGTLCPHPYEATLR